MTATYRSSTTYASGASQSSSIVLNLPASTASGDLLIACLSGSTGMVSGGVTPPGGWTTLYAPTDGTFSDNNYAAYYKVAGASEPGSYTFSLGTTSTVAATLVCVTATNGTIRANRFDEAAGTGTSFTSTALSGTQATDLTLVLGLMGDDVGANSTETPPGSPWNPIANVVSDYPSGPSCHASVCSWAIGSQSGATFTSTSSTAVWGVITLSVEPSGTGLSLVSSTQFSAVASSATVTIPSTTAGNALIVLVNCNGASANNTVSGITLGGSGTGWSKNQAVGALVFTDVEVWDNLNIAGGQTSCVVTGSGGTGTQTTAGWVLEVSGLLQSGARDQDSTNSSASTASTWSSGTTPTLSQSGEFAFGIVAGSVSALVVTGPVSPWVNFTQITQATGHVGALAGYSIVSSTAAQTYNGGFSPNSAQAAIVVTYEAAPVTPTLVQSKTGSWASGTTVTITLGSGTTAGNCLIVCVASAGSTNPNVSGITLGGSAGNFASAVVENGNTAFNAEIWADPGCAGGQTSVVITVAGGSGTLFGDAIVMEWSGLVTSSVTDVTSGDVDNTSVTAWTSNATATTSQASELAVGIVTTGGTTTITPPGSPWTNVAVLAGDVEIGYNVLSATQAVTYSGTFSPAEGWTAAVATFKAVAPVTPLLVQSKSGTAASITSLTIALTSATTAGNCLIVCVGTEAGTTNPGVSGITLGGSADNFAAVPSATAGSSGGVALASFWADPNCAGGQTSVVITCSGGSGTGAINAFVLEVSDLIATAPGDQAVGHTGTTALSWTSNATGTTTQASEFAVGFVQGSVSGGTTITGPASPWTNLTQLNSGGGGECTMVGWQVLSSTGTVTYAGTNTPTAPYVAIAATFKAVAPVAGVAGASAILQPGGRTWQRRFRHRQQVPVAQGLTPPVTVALTTPNITLTAPVLAASAALPVTASWSGSSSRTPLAYVTGPPPGVILEVPVTNTTGGWMFAVVSWRQDAGQQGTVTYPSSVSVSDDAGNLWIPVSQSQSHQGSVAQSRVWMAPAARPASFVYVQPVASPQAVSLTAPAQPGQYVYSSYQAAVTALIFEVPAACPWYEVALTTGQFAVSGGGVSVSATVPSGTFLVGSVAWDNLSGSVTPSAAGWTEIGSGVSTSNGTDNTGDLKQLTYIAESGGSPLTLAASGSPGMDWYGTVIAVHGVTDVLPCPYAQPLENWPAIITEIAAGPVLNANPFCNSTAIWGIQNGTELAGTWPQFSPWPDYGTVVSGSILVTPSGAAAYVALLSELIPVSMSTEYQPLAWVYSPAGWPVMGVQVWWYDNTSTFISATGATAAVPVMPGAWTLLSLPGPVYPPENAAYGQCAVVEGSLTGPVLPAQAVFYAGYAAFGLGQTLQGLPQDDQQWSDISSRNITVGAMEITRGIQYEQQSLEAGTLKMTLANNDSQLTLGNLLSSYWPQAGDTDVPVRVRAIWPLSETPYYPMFSGYTDETDFAWASAVRYGYAEVQGADAWSRLTQQMLPAAEEDVLLDNPQGYWTCNLAGTNLAPNGVTALTTQICPGGSAGGAGVFSGNNFQLPGDQGVSNWQSTGIVTTASWSQGVALVLSPSAVAVDTLPPAAGGETVEFWFSPQSDSTAQPAAQPCTICSCVASGNVGGTVTPLWDLSISNTGLNATASVTVYDQGTGLGTTTGLTGSAQLLNTSQAASFWYAAVSFTQTSLTVFVAGSSGQTSLTTVSCNLTNQPSKIFWGGIPLPETYSTSRGPMNLAVYGVAVYPRLLPPDRQASHFWAAASAFPWEIDVMRLARIIGYAGFAPPAGFRGLGLPAPAAWYANPSGSVQPTRDFDTMTAATDTSGQVASDYFTNIAGSTDAAMFVNGAGVLQYRRRLEWYDRLVPQWVLGDSPSLALNSNGSFGSGITGWTVTNSATLSSVIVPSGAPSAYFDSAGIFSGNGIAGAPGIVSPSSGSIPVTAGSWYQLSALLWSPQGWTSGAYLTVSWYNGGSPLTTVTTTIVQLDAGSLTFLQSAPLQAPVTANGATITVSMNGTPPSVTGCYVTNVVFSRASVVTAGGAEGQTATEAPYLDSMKLSADRAQLYNQAILNQYGTNTSTTFTATELVFAPTSGITVQITNEASVTLRGQVPYTATIYEINTAQALPYVLADPSMEDFGNWVVQTQGNPLLRVKGVTITPAASPQSMLTGLGCEVGDTVTIRRRPVGTPEIQILAYCSKITHHIDIASAAWTTEYEVSPFSTGQVLQCDSVVNGCLTGGSAFGW